MAIYKPGRLRRTLNKIGLAVPTFGFYCEQLGTLYDDDIHSVVITRGKSGRGGGYNPTLLEISVRGKYSAAIAGKEGRFFIRDLQADPLGAVVGKTGATIARRFTGRVGQTTVEDTGKIYTTTIGAASWLAQMNYSTASFDPLVGHNLNTVIRGISHASDPNRGINMVPVGTTEETISQPRDPVTFRDGIGPYAQDLGILLQETREGVTRILPTLWRIGDVKDRLATELPLIRSQAISPAVWEQLNESPGLKVDYTITNDTGGVATRTAETENTSGENRETQAVDWSFIQVPTVDNQLYREAYGRVFEANTRQFKIPSVTVDLLRLIGSDKPYHRQQAGQLLALEAGDPVFFSGDWPAELRGVQMAEGITETINSEQWTMELSLVPYAQALGDTPAPVVPGRVWDSMIGSWDQENRKWDEV